MCTATGICLDLLEGYRCFAYTCICARLPVVLDVTKRGSDSLELEVVRRHVGAGDRT